MGYPALQIPLFGPLDDGCNLMDRLLGFADVDKDKPRQRKIEQIEQSDPAPSIKEHLYGQRDNKQNDGCDVGILDFRERG